jgi:glutaredoxin 3
MEVSIYTTATCHFCHLAKDFFTANNIAYNEYNVGQDTERLNEMVQMTGQMGVPVIRINNDVVVGFNEKQVRSLLGM